MLKECVTKLRDLDYGTIYSAKGEQLDLTLQRRICFRAAFDKFYNNDEHTAHYELQLIRDPKYNQETGYNNICLLTKEELKRHLKLARRLFPFKYVVEDSEYGGLPSFRVFIDISGVHYYHKYLLTWIRYAYEIPYNLILWDALHLKHTYLRKESITNLYVLCANSFNDNVHYYGNGHSMPYRNSGFLKEANLKAAILRGSLNDIYPRLAYSCTRFQYSEEAKYLEYWLDEEEFEKRKDTYLANYKLMIGK